MRLTLLFTVFANFLALSQELTPPTLPAEVFPSQPFIHAEIWECGCGMEAHYAGGSNALSRFVNEHLDLSSEIYWGNTTHVRLYVQFIVEKDGTLSDVHIAKTNFPEIDQAVLSVFGEMTNWIAGEDRCEVVRTRVRVPVSIEVR